MATLRTLLLVLVALVPAAPAVAAPPALPGPFKAPAPTVADACADCGKRIYFGERCLTCILAEKRSAKEHPCLDCQDTILFGERCAACAVVHQRTRLTEALAHPCADCDEEILFGERCRACTATDLSRRLTGLVDLARRGGATAKALAPVARERLEAVLGLDRDEQQRAADAKTEQAALERYAGAAKAWATEAGGDLKDGLAEASQRPLAAIGAGLEAAAGLHRAKRDLAQRGLDGLGRIPVTSELGRTSLEDLARAKLLEAAPELQGSELVDDPAAVLAALITLDHLYFLTDLQLVQGEGDAPPLTILEALEAGTDGDPGVALACITILESVRKLRRGEDITRSLYDIERSLELLNPDVDLEAEQREEPEPAPEPEEPER